MKKIFLFFIINAFCQCSAQNLVPNGDLEQFVKHYSGVCIDSSALTAVNWYSPTNGTPTYCNGTSCWNEGVPQNVFGYQFANSGSGYEIVTLFAKECSYEHRDYIQVALFDSLKAGRKYNVKFYVSLCDTAQYAIDDIGALFTMNPLIDTVTNPPPIILATPQVINEQGNYLTSRTEWMLISDTLIAAGGEKYITIGNFKNDANIDTLFVPGGSENTSYCFWSGYYIDDVSVELDTTQGVEDVAVNKPEILIYPQPAKNVVTIEVLGAKQELSLELYDIQGQLLLRRKMLSAREQLDLTSYSKGLYLIKITGRDFVRCKKVVKE
jgi:OmpA-OmpF porin, OOP family